MRRVPQKLSRGNATNLGLLLLSVVLIFLYIATPPSRARIAIGLPKEETEGYQVDNVFGSRIPVKLLNGSIVVLGPVLTDKVVLVVNVASNCGFTELNYRELQQMQVDLGPKGFTVLAAPCNQFGGQEPGSASQIQQFAIEKGATFPILDKLEVNGPDTHPLFAALKKATGTSAIEWNFGKFLVGRGGVVLRYYDHRFPFELIRSHVTAVVELPRP